MTIVKNQRENTDNVFTYKFDNWLVQSNVKTNSTLLLLYW